MMMTMKATVMPTNDNDNKMMMKIMIIITIKIRINKSRNAVFHKQNCKISTFM